MDIKDLMTQLSGILYRNGNIPILYMESDKAGVPIYCGFVSGFVDKSGFPRMGLFLASEETAKKLTKPKLEALPSPPEVRSNIIDIKTRKKILPI